VRTPTTTMSTSARSRCRCSMPAGQLIYFEWPVAVAMRPSSDWPTCPTITRSSTVPVRSGPNKSAQACGRGCCPLRKRSTKLSHSSEEANLRAGKLPSCTAEFKIRFSRVINATIGHPIRKIHLISGGMIQDFRCSTNAPSKRRPRK